MTFTPQEKQILDFVEEYTNANQETFGIGLITQAVICHKFGLTKQRADQIGVSLQRRGFIKRDKGKSSNFWEIV